MPDEQYRVTFNTTEEFLKERYLSIEILSEAVDNLLEIFGERYEEFFPLHIESHHIDNVVNTNNIFKKIMPLEGFERHIANYTPIEYDSHFYTATVASYLLDLNYEVILEPEMDEDTGPHPDLLVTKDDENCYVECKTSEIDGLYDRKRNKEFAEHIYDEVKTCDKIDFTLHRDMSLEEFKSLIDDDFIQTVYFARFNHPNSREFKWKVNDDVEVNIIFQPPIIGAEEDFPEVEILGILVNIDTRTKRIGCQFLKGGRSIGIYEILDFKRKLKNQRRKSNNQLIDGFPNIVFVKDSTFLGDAETNKNYIEKTWLTEENKWCSGIVLFDTYNDIANSGLNNAFEFIVNKYAEMPYIIQ